MIAPPLPTSWLASAFTRTAKPCCAGSADAVLLNSLATSVGLASAAVSLVSLTFIEPSLCSSMPMSDSRPNADDAALLPRKTLRRLLCSVRVGRSPCKAAAFLVAASYLVCAVM